MRCTRCEKRFKHNEDYYIVWNYDVYLCEDCMDETVNAEFCDMCEIQIVPATMDEGDPERCDY